MEADRRGGRSAEAGNRSSEKTDFGMMNFLVRIERKDYSHSREMKTPKPIFAGVQTAGKGDFRKANGEGSQILI